jgi:hypothetical protein
VTAWDDVSISPSVEKIGPQRYAVAINSPVVEKSRVMATNTVPAPNRHAATPHQTPPVGHAAGIIVGLTAILAVVFIAFALPAAKSAPRDVPIGVAGPGASAAQIEEQLARTAPGGFLVTNYGDEAALREAITRRDVYGGVASTPQGPAVLIASGGSPMIAQSLSQIAAGLSQRAGLPVRTEDLAPLPGTDPRGVGLSAAALPLTLAGLLPAAALLLAFPNWPWLRLGAFATAAVLMTLTITALLRFVFGSIDAHFWAVSAGLLLGVLAMGLPVLGLGSLFGRAGIGIAAAVGVLLGNPLSGLAGAPQLPPERMGRLRPTAPPGRQRDLAALDGLLPGSVHRRHRNRGPGGPWVLGAGRCAAHSLWRPWSFTLGEVSPTQSRRQFQPARQVVVRGASLQRAGDPQSQQHVGGGDEQPPPVHPFQLRVGCRGEVTDQEDRAHDAEDEHHQLDAHVTPEP